MSVNWRGVRLLVYVAVLIYLFLDLFVVSGPVRQAMRRGNPRSPERIAAEKAQGVVARVYYQPILLSQVDRRVEERLWKEGRLGNEVAAQERNILRLAALSELIDLHLLRLKVDFNAGDYPVAEEEISAAVQRFVSRFPNRRELEDALSRQGWTEKELRMRLAARIQQEKYLAALIDVSVSEEECRGWYEAHKEELAVPQRVHVRHIFIATLEREEEEAKRIIGEALGRLRRGEAEFEDLALAISEDERSRENGGDLGWAHAGRLPGDFAAPVLAMEPREPGLVHTKLGWHLVEVLERKGKEVPAYDAVKPEVAAALEAVKREEGWELYREQLRRMSGDKVEIFHDVLEAGTPGDPGGPDAATGRATPVPPRPRPGSAPTDGPR